MVCLDVARKVYDGTYGKLFFSPHKKSQALPEVLKASADNFAFQGTIFLLPLWVSFVLLYLMAVGQWSKDINEKEKK